MGQLALQYIPLFNDPSGGPEQYLIFQQQIDSTWIWLGVGSQPDPDAPGANSIVLPGVLATLTATVVDTPEKRLMTDAQRTAMVTLAPLGTAPISAQLAAAGAMTGAMSVLASVTGVNMNQDAASLLYTVPNVVGRLCVVTAVVLKQASIALSTASISFGWTSPTFADVIANAAHTTVDTTHFERIVAKVGALVGSANQGFYVICNTKQGGAATVKIDVLGFLI